MTGFRAEPVLITTAIGALLVLMVEFGVPVTDGQQTAIQTLIAAALALFARSQVVSESTMNKAGTTSDIVTDAAASVSDPLTPTMRMVSVPAKLRGNGRDIS